MNKQIGLVKLDYKYYSGKDFYSDGDIEDSILDIVKNYPKEEFPNIIREAKSWPVFYHLSEQRHNIIENIGINKEAKVLEVGSGCGAITGKLSELAKEVVSIDLSGKRSTINAYRNKDCDNLTIKVGNFKDIEPDLECDYDYILLIGVFEYAQGYMGGDTPYLDFLNILKKHLKNGGRLVIAIENQYGMKYWAGCREDHLATFFSGIEGYNKKSGVRTFTKKGLEDIIERSGELQYEFFYPYPDYKFMRSLYSERYLPRKGELNSNQNNFDMDRLELFDEELAFDAAIEAGYFEEFSNSFMVIIGPKLETAYTRYSNERADKYKICTQINTSDSGYKVIKRALTKAASTHINEIKTSYDRLSSNYNAESITFNKIVDYCDVDGYSKVEFEFVDGYSLDGRFDWLLENNQIEGFFELFKEYFKKISDTRGEGISNIDFIFSNIMVKENGSWVVIDYEWVENKDIPSCELAYRAYYLYCVEKNRKFDDEYLKADSVYYGDKVEVISGETIREILDITDEKAKEIRDSEVGFQAEIVGNEITKSEILIGIDTKVYDIEKVKSNKREELMRIQVYEDTGKGFSENESYFLNRSENGENKISFNFSNKIKKLRLDPCMCKSVIEVNDIRINGKRVGLLNTIILTNGKKIGKNRFIFDSSDPNILLPVGIFAKNSENIIELTYYLETLN